MSSTVNNTFTTYDIIFAGGGTAGCITAARLASADSSLKILIIEAGPHTKDIPGHIQPARFLANFTLPDAPFKYHVAKPSDALDGRSMVVSAGECLGGGSSVNLMMYTRASASDYDDWESVHGNSGWGSKYLIPLLKKAETFQPGARPENATHGDSGPIKVSYSETHIGIATQFLDVAKVYDTERGSTEDVNGFFSCNRYGRWPKYVDETSGKRSDVPHHYIYNQDHKNLKVKDKCRVKRVIFERNRAVGVEYIDEKVEHAEGVQEVHTVYASRLVVVSSGTLGSPAILERSGIGAADILRNNGIVQIVDLPGVGENYMDHDGTAQPYHASEEAETLDVIYSGEESEIQPHVEEWMKTGKGLLSNNGIDAGIKMRPNAKDLIEIGSTFQKRWQDYFANAPDKPVAYMGCVAWNLGAHPPGPRQKYFCMGYYSQYPESIGRIHITSGQDVNAPLDFEGPFLKAPSDVAVLRWIYKKSREFARRMSAYRGELVFRHPHFAAGSAAAAATTDGPVAITAPDIVYSAEDDEAIDAFHREQIASAWHSMGTCAMKARENGGVVDSMLNVYGVQNLKVADLSIAPANVGSNTYNTAIAVGEKAAMIIAEELGIKGV